MNSAEVMNVLRTFEDKASRLDIWRDEGSA